MNAFQLALHVFIAFLVAAPLARGQTTLTVTTAGDEFGENGGACALREAIQAANTQAAFGGCTWNGTPLIVELPPGTYALSRVGTAEDANATGDLDLTADMVVVGAGMDVTVIDGLGQDRLLHIFEGAAVELRGLKVTNGRTLDGTSVAFDTEAGGGIYNAGHLTLRDCAVSENATGDSGGPVDGIGEGGSSGDGGGVYNSASATLVLSECVLESNETGAGGDALLGEGGDGGDGGAIYNAGTVTLYRSALLRNRTGDGGRGMDFPGTGGRGGGLFNEGEEVNIEESEISDNRTSDDYDYGRLSPGGGIASLSGSVRIVRSTLSLNRTRGYGGGLYMEGDTLRIANSTFSGNRAFTYGGGLALVLETAATLDNLTIYHNSISHNFDGPGGGPSGGGLFVGEETAVQLRNSILAGNRDLFSFPEVGPSDCGGPLVSEGYNLVGNQYGCSGSLQDTDQSGTWTPDSDNRLDPRLSSLADHGGPTNTHLPLEDSPAVDMGSCTDIAGAIIEADQRGAERPSGEACDIGSVERETTPIATEPAASPESALHSLIVYPNPTRSSVTVELTLRRSEDMVVEAFDVLGRRVDVLQAESLAAGAHRLALDMSALPRGVYLVRISSETFSETRRVTVLR